MDILEIYLVGFNWAHMQLILIFLIGFVVLGSKVSIYIYIVSAS